MWDKLVEKLKSILEANSLIQEVYDYENESFRGDPVAVVTPSANEADYHSTCENRRIYAFNIKVIVDRTTRGDQACEEIIRGLVDSVIDDIDKNYQLSGVEQPTGYTMLFVEALPSVWGYIERENVYRVAEINVRCHVDVDVNLIS